MSASTIFLVVSFFAAFFAAIYLELRNGELERENEELWKMYGGSVTIERRVTLTRSEEGKE